MKPEEIKLSTFKYKTPIQIRYIDIDMQGHVNNAIFLSYIEQSRVDYMNTLLPNNDFNTNGLIIARTEIDYFQPIFLHDKIYCYTKISSVRNRSFTFENVLASDNNSIKCFAKSIMVCFNYNNNSTIHVPEHWREKILAFEEF